MFINLFLCATDKARKSIIKHCTSFKTHWQNKQGVKIRTIEL